ncbi:shikimate kinase [Desulfomarina sp.]
MTQSYSEKNIVLTGFMGTGKTTVGKLLAKKLQRKFIDTDFLIEKRQQLSIPDIFRNLGEKAFRRMEATVARELGQKKELVISTGGRLMLDPDNATALESTGLVFCLNAGPETILSRLEHDENHARPLLQGPDPHRKILQLMNEREQGYRRFTTIETDGIQPDEIADTILDFIRLDS